jgi:type IV secretion system protein VirB10
VAISHKPILEPEVAKPGVPLRRSTVIVLLILLLVMGMASSLVFSGSGKPAATAAKEDTPVRQIGTAAALTDEEVDASREAERRAREERLAKASPSSKPAASASASPLPGGRPAETTGVLDQIRSGRNIGASGQADGRADELERAAKTRLAPPVVFDTDADSTKAEHAQAGAGNPQPSMVSDTSGGVFSTKDAEVAARLELFKNQALAQQQRRSSVDWLREYEGSGKEKGRVLTGYQATKRLVLRQGKIIPAILGRQINSDLPGRITAYVASDVYDRQGELLIPKGATLVGQYDSEIKVGQSRVMFAFERLILPNGYSFDLPAANGSDLAGAAGVTGDVNNHFFKMFGTSLLIALLGEQLQQPASVTQVGTSGPTTAAGQVLSDVAKTILERNRIIPPTITVDQGTRINVEVVADMVFPESYRAK